MSNALFPQPKNSRPEKERPRETIRRKWRTLTWVKYNNKIRTAEIKIYIFTVGSYKMGNRYQDTFSQFVAIDTGCSF